ncbi:hypothetical protein GCM10009839_83040 [Catenulispora yoronensis]|uniref:GH18 domain-containing protein n=2 Tax=Catenulispora yoronensis TaxID=450799 RepID=A0ABP5GZS7_9ACTN
MAFIQAATKGSCTVYWNGDTSMPISSSTFGASITKIRAAGGDVIPSFGGYTADNTGTEIADSCTNVSSIAAAYENVITTYDVTRIDLDTEDNSLTNTAGIDRRNKAIKMVEDWAAANGRTIQFTYTLPTTTSGLASSGLKVLQNAVTNNARIDTVNIMTFDYYDNAGTHNMANDTKTAATGLKNQLATLYPSKTTAQLWGMIGVTEMPGIDDFGAAETFQTADAAPVLSWAQSNGIGEISFWALQRDNGGCPGTGGSDTCSGISQSQWFFSNTFAPFTSGGTTTNDFSVSVSPTSGSVPAGSSATATVSTAVTSGSAQSVSLTASGAPSGTTVTFNPSSVTAGGSSTATIATSASTPAGTYPITITGTGATGTHTATYNLTVTSAPTNDFSVSVAPSSGSVAQAGSATATVSTAVTAGTAQSVTLTATGAPTGATVTFNPSSVTAGGTSTFTVATSASTPPGTYPITIKGTAASGSHTTTYTLTVTGVVTNDFSVSVAPASGSVTAGSSATATVSTAVTSGSAQTVALTATGAPTGATVTLNPTSVTAGGTSALTVATSASTPAGTYPITITGTAASGSHSATYTLTVTTGGTTTIVNGDFESGSLSPWTCQSGDAVVSSPVHGGTHAARISATSSATGECDQTVTLTPNKSYTLKVWVQGNFAFAGVSGGASASTWATGSTWTQLSIPFTTGANGTVTVFVHGWFGQGDVYADDFTLS